MKKALVLIVLALLVFSLASPVFAASDTDNDINNFSVKQNSDGTVTISGFDTGKSTENFFDKYKKLISMVSAFVFFTMILLLYFAWGKLAASLGSPQKRTEAIAALVVIAIATAGSGATAVFMTFFYGAFR